MFLLIQEGLLKIEGWAREFTFHNVSINSNERRGFTGRCKRIYIPQCFY